MTNVAVPARPRPLEAAAAPHTNVAGLELDGPVAVCALARAGTVRDVVQVTGRSPRDAIAGALGKVGRVDAVVVAWGAPSGLLSERSFPLVGLASRRSALDALAADIGAPGLACARLGDRISGRNEVNAIVGTADHHDVAEVWAAASGHGIQLVLAPMVISTDGIWLGLRRADADLTMVVDGLPRRSRRILPGGLDALAATLSGYGGDGWSSLHDILSGRIEPGSEAVRITDEHVTSLCGAVKETLASWRRTQRLDASTVYVYGAGSALPTLEARLATAGIQALAPPALPDAPGLDAGRRADGWLAIQAALTDPSAFIGFPDQAADARRAALSRAASKSRTLVVSAALGGAALLGVLVPMAHGRLTRHIAGNRLAAAQREIKRLGPEERIYRYVEAATGAWAARAASEPDWARELDAILKSAPSGVVIVSIQTDDSTSPGFIAVTLHAQGGPQAFADLEAWAAVLAANHAVTRVFAPSAQSDAQPGHSATKTSFDLQFDIAAPALQSARPFPLAPK